MRERNSDGIKDLPNYATFQLLFIISKQVLKTLERDN